MTPNTNQNPEAVPKTPTLTESVDSLIQKKQAEKSAEAKAVVQQSAEGIQGEVADVMAGVDKPKEKVSEREGESGEKGDIKGGGTTQSDENSLAAKAGIASFIFPVEEVMVKKIRTAINIQIRREMKRAEKLKKNITTGSAQEYNSAIARIRRLKGILASLFNATFEAIKNIYIKYFTPEGRRRTSEEIEV